mmetsp:Transcript_12395/g.24922  ORF Transcript_12395/g.24922 Transcript_12395/m.24922 type:complete len:146 (+) Transcript_12395:2803-3240(+)
MPHDDPTQRLVSWFHSPGLPLPRVPTQLADGSFDLIFPSETSRKEQQQCCRVKVSHNCFEGARYVPLRCSKTNHRSILCTPCRKVCSVQALKACRPSWISSFLRKGDSKDRRQLCEENYSSACEDKAKIDCGTHSRNFCEAIFTP